MKKFAALILIIALIAGAFASCTGRKVTSTTDATSPAGAVGGEDDAQQAEEARPAGEIKAGDESNPVVTMEMEDGGVITMELYYDVAPNTVLNFISLIKSGFYDGLTFHRVIPGFMIQGGCPDGNGFGDPGYSIADEFTSAGFENNLSHKKGVLSMARSKMPDSAGSQFFICVADSEFLDGDYAAFGAVLDGMDVAEKIVNVERDANDKPLEDVVIKSMTVDTKGVDYPEPVTIPD